MRLTATGYQGHKEVSIAISIVTLVQAIKGIGDAVVVQQVSRRRPRATDFRLIQGAIYANGVGILLVVGLAFSIGIGMQQRHYASSVRHQKYHGLDVVTVRVAR